jgi:hypothetical protein
LFTPQANDSQIRKFSGNFFDFYGTIPVPARMMELWEEELT